MTVEPTANHSHHSEGKVINTQAHSQHTFATKTAPKKMLDSMLVQSLGGLEPPTPRSEVWCAIHCATGTRSCDAGSKVPLSQRSQRASHSVSHTIHEERKAHIRKQTTGWTATKAKTKQKKNHVVRQQWDLNPRGQSPST
jgi:hypothetical protein